MSIRPSDLQSAIYGTSASAPLSRARIEARRERGDDPAGDEQRGRRGERQEEFVDEADAPPGNTIDLSA